MSTYVARVSPPKKTQMCSHMQICICSHAYHTHIHLQKRKIIYTGVQNTLTLKLWSHLARNIEDPKITESDNLKKTNTKRSQWTCTCVHARTHKQTHTHAPHFRERPLAWPGTSALSIQQREQNFAAVPHMGRYRGAGCWWLRVLVWTANQLRKKRLGSLEPDQSKHN